MIARVSFENFKSLKNVSIDLGRFTVLVGPNGSGKSSVLKGVRLITQLGQVDLYMNRQSRGRIDLLFAGLNVPWRLNSTPGPSTLRFRIDDDSAGSLSLGITNLAMDDMGTSWTNVHCFCQVETETEAWGFAIPGTPEMPYHNDLFDDPRLVRFSNATFLQLDSRAMVKTYVSDDERPRLKEDGTNLASVLAWLKGAAEDELANTTEALRKIVPGVKRIRTFREKVPRRRFDQVRIDDQPVWRPVDELAIGDRFEIEFDNGISVPADLLSEGTVLVLGLLTKLHEPGRPKLILLDDIDRGLHIEAQAQLIKVLRELLALDPELQIVCTTHSPYLVSRCEPDEVRVLALDELRQTHARPLTTHPDFDKWRFGVQTGELWAALGEGWVTGTAVKS